MKKDYSKAYREVLEVLKYIPKEDLNKIPKEVLELFKKEEDKNYIFSLDKSIEFKEQILLYETKVILAYLYIDYWADKEEKKEIYNIYQEAEEKLNKQKEIESPIDVFNKKNNDVNNIEENIKTKIDKTNKLLEFKEPKWYEKILNYFKNIFRK